MASESTFFTRKASGLVREISPFSTFIYNAYSINPILTLAFMLLPYRLLTQERTWPRRRCGRFTRFAIVFYLYDAVDRNAAVRRQLRLHQSRSWPAAGVHGKLERNYFVYAFYLGAPCVLFAKWGVAGLLRLLAFQYSAGTFLLLANWSASPMGSFVLGTAFLALLISLYIVTFAGIFGYKL